MDFKLKKKHYYISVYCDQNEFLELKKKMKFLDEDLDINDNQYLLTIYIVL